jgi:hypothetical protein
MYLDWDIVFLSNLPKDESCDSICGISLVGIVLYNKTLVHFGLMVLFMLILVVQIILNSVTFRFAHSILNDQFPAIGILVYLLSISAVIHINQVEKR